MRTAHVMQCLWPSTKSQKFVRGTFLRGTVVAFLIFAGTGGIVARTVAWTTTAPAHGRIPLVRLEETLHQVPAHISEFSPVSPPLALAKCGDVRPPEALLTPDPVLRSQEDDLKVKVSFIVGSDGHVHSAFVLESGGPDEDQILLHAVRFWRYRPALCNGVPTDSEALVRFSLR